ncbi:MAG: prepilin-type N-terminal cleavage/methylation domain-containing protein [Actinomycetes bacterium]
MRAMLVLRRRLREDGGFTLVELVVAMVIISGVLLGLMSVQVGALQTVTLSKERQQATALANRTMEQLRALPYDTVTGGLRSTDVAGDPNIASGRLKPDGYPNSIDEALVTGATASVSPLFPHRQAGSATKVGKVQYTVGTYVTLASATAGDTTAGYWLTVLVTWASEETGGATKTVSTRSRLFSPNGCLATSTHPFSGPCQAFFDASAGTSPASLGIASAGPEGSLPVADNALRTGSVDLPSLASGVQSEQTVSVQGKAATSGASYTNGSAGPIGTGTVAATTGASTDPETGEASVPQSATVTQSASTLSSVGSASTFTLQAATGDSARSASTTSATSGGSCRNLAAVSLASGQACSSSEFTPGGTLSAALQHGSATIPLGSVAAAPAPSRAFASRYVSSSTPYCSGASGAGCISANVSRALGAAAVGGVPASATGTPAGFTSMVTLENYSDGAGAESGVGAQPSSAQRSGTLKYWNGTAYTSVSLGAGTSSQLDAAEVSVAYSGPGGAVTLNLSGSVRVTPVVKDATGVSPCQPDACGVNATAGSVVATVTYTMTTSAGTIGHFIVTYDLGSSAAKTSYRAAPSA